MESYVLLGIIILCIFVWKRKYRENNVNKKVAQKETVDGIYIVDTNNYRKELVATFRNGVVYSKFNHPMGYYDNNGNVYNTEREKIGFVRECRMYMSREFMYERLVKILPDTQLKKPYDLVRSLGEVLGGMSGSIFENDEYENATAFYELKNKNILGVGAAYIVLVYEDWIKTENRSYYKLEAKDCF